jgi:hypothetical protein
MKKIYSTIGIILLTLSSLSAQSYKVKMVDMAYIFTDTTVTTKSNSNLIPTATHDVDKVVVSERVTNYMGIIGGNRTRFQVISNGKNITYVIMTTIDSFTGDATVLPAVRVKIVDKY